MEISTADAARLLGVSDDEVRRLLRKRALAGRRISRTWLVDAEDVQRRRHLAASRGRVWTAPVAFAALLLLAGRSDTGLTDSETSRLRRAVRDGDTEDVLRRARQLVIVERWRVPSVGLEWVLDQAGVFVTGESATGRISDELVVGTDSMASRVLHVGVVEDELERVRVGARARGATGSANVVVHVVRAARLECFADEQVQAVITALVLSTHTDARLRGAAARFLAERLQALRRRGRV